MSSDRPQRRRIKPVRLDGAFTISRRQALAALVVAILAPFVAIYAYESEHHDSYDFPKTRCEGLARSSATDPYFRDLYEENC